MKTSKQFLRIALVLFVVSPSPGLAQVALETANLRLEIGADGALKSLLAKPTGTQYAWLEQPTPVAKVYRGGQVAVSSQAEYAENEAPVYQGGQSFPATAASLAGDRLTLRFAQAGATATYQLIQTRDYLAFRLLTLEGGPVDRIDLLRLSVKRLPHLGPWIDVAYDDRFGICLCGGNIQTNAGMKVHDESVEMMAVAEKRVALEGTTAVLFGCPDPKNQFLEVMEIVERDFHMPAGARHRRSPEQKASYFWCPPTPENVGQYVEVAKRAGVRTIILSYWTFSKGAGHFVWNEQYPRGMADLKKVADAIRAAGLKAGLHLHYCKATTRDPYVTPVPDERFHKLRTFTLARPIDATAATIAVRENPQGCTKTEGLRICRRGHLKSIATPHPAGDRAELLDVDDWNIFIRFDQDTDIQDEVAGRIAEICRQTGPYDMIYFDGAEDVHDPFWYHVANSQYRVYRRLQPEPTVCETAMCGHFSWHMMSRGNAYDVVDGHVKNFCYHVCCRTAPIRAEDFTRINFGWIAPFSPTVEPDVLEYVLSRAAAWDCPISLRLNPRDVASHPRTDDCLAVLKTWEDARIGNHLTDAQRQMLKTLDPKEYRFVKVWHAVLSDSWIKTWKDAKFTDQEHHLLVNEKGQYELVPIQEIADLPKGLRAYWFQRASQPHDTYVLLWMTRGERELSIPLSADRLAALRPFTTSVPVKSDGKNSTLTVGARTYLLLKGMQPTEAQAILRKVGLR
jgi:hypothetical protein